jgi:hypothetical protein
VGWGIKLSKMAWERDRRWTFLNAIVFNKMRGLSVLIKELSASQEKLCSME